MFQTANDADRWVVRLHRSSCAQGGLHQAGRAGACSARASGRAAGSGAGCARSEATYTPTRSASHDTGVDAAEGGASLGSLNVGVGDGKVVAGDGQIEIILQRQSDRVLQ